MHLKCYNLAKHLKFDTKKLKNLPKTVLFGALDWGLGHATRSIPILSFFLEKGWELVIAANAGPKKILQEAFPEATFLEPPSYNITYSKQSSFFTLRLMQQAPRINRVISTEKGWVDQIIQQRSVHLIISDNRYGFYHKNVPSWIITHQLSPISGLGKTIDGLIRRFHYRLLKPFDKILVPDLPFKPGMAGRLAHPSLIPPHTHYIGLLSRLSTLEVPTLEVPTLEILIVLSGPEPSRSIFEEALRRQLRFFKGRYLLVRGLPHVSSGQQEHELNYADPKTLKALIQASALVICRSGYSSVMDLLAIEKKAVLIPTPGQTEQLYLAAHLEKQGLFPTMNEHEFDLTKAMEKAKAFNHPGSNNAFVRYKKVLEELIDDGKI